MFATKGTNRELTQPFCPVGVSIVTSDRVERSFFLQTQVCNNFESRIYTEFTVLYSNAAISLVSRRC